MQVIKHRQAIYQRVLPAYRRHYPSLRGQLARMGIACGNVQLFVRVFKYEQILEVWIKDQDTDLWLPFDQIPFCGSSGKLGPKRKEGDRQIPEGIYHVDRFNPNSRYHLSLGINYPNASDRFRGEPVTPGSDIFIHGGCESVGCVAITDEGIERVYILARIAHQAGQRQIPVHIFPFRMEPEQFDRFVAAHSRHQAFWTELLPIYRSFQADRLLRPITISLEGKYELENISDLHSR